MTIRMFVHQKTPFLWQISDFSGTFSGQIIATDSAFIRSPYRELCAHADKTDQKICRSGSALQLSSFTSMGKRI